MEAALITAGDARKRITWAPEVVQAALRAGTVLDHDGHVAPLDLLPPPTRHAVLAMMQQGAPPGVAAPDVAAMDAPALQAAAMEAAE